MPSTLGAAARRLAWGGLSWRLPRPLRPDGGDGDSTTPRYRPVVLLTHLLALLLTCNVVLSSNKALLFIGYDGAYYRTLIKQQHEWMSRAPWFGYNPFQGLGNTFFCVHTRYAPGYAVAAVVGGGSANPILVFTMVAVETFLAVLLMTWCLRLRPALGLLAAWALTLLTLPFTFPPLLYPIAMLCPHFIEYVAALCILIGLFHRIGQHGRWVTVALTLALAGQVLWCVICSAMMVLLMVPTLLLLFLLSLASSATRRERWAKVLALAAILAVLLPNAIPYFVGNYLYSVPVFFGSELPNVRLSRIWTSVLFHSRVEGWFGPILFSGGMAGAVLACFSGSFLFRRLALTILAAAGTLVAGGLYLTEYLPNYAGPSPLYFEFFLWPFYCLMLAFLVLVVLRAPLLWLQETGQQGRLWSLTAGPFLRYHLPALLLPVAAVVGSHGEHGQSSYCPSPFPPAETPLIRTLREATGLREGAEFRGMTATFTGYCRQPDGVWWGNLLGTDGMCLSLVGNDFRAIGLWYFAIPTLFEYNQFMTPAYYLMMTRMLTRPQDRQIRSVIVLTKPNLPYLRSLGVRFLLTDFPLAAPGATLVQTEAIQPAGGLTLYLHELADPNLATYSPTRIVVAPSAQETVERLQRADFDFTTEAVADSPLPENLVKATSSHLNTHKDRLIVEAGSPGTSVLLLPLQYSHCLELDVLSADGPKPRLVRLNGMQTGLVFTGSIRAELRFANGPFRNSFGRIEDYRDMRKLLAAGVGPVK